MANPNCGAADPNTSDQLRASRSTYRHAVNNHSDIVSSCSCEGSIVNLFSFPSNNCNSNDTSASPFFYNQKIAAVDGQTSKCIRVSTPNYRASSFVFTRDGVEDSNCQLRTYHEQDCRDEFQASYNVDEDVSGCIVTNFRAVKLAC